jgi:hypothetical protein
MSVALTRCLERHAKDDSRIGQALCGKCYDDEGAALWNANLGALWRRTITYLPRELAALSGLRTCSRFLGMRVGLVSCFGAIRPSKWGWLNDPTELRLDRRADGRL